MDCFLVLPCFRESARLPPFLDALTQTIAASRFSVEVQLVDDGSGEGELRRLREILAERTGRYPFLRELVAIDNNRGKGAAIRAGWAQAPEACRLLGFVDADGAVGASEVIRLMGEGLSKKGEALIVSSRRVPESDARRLLSRRLLASAFSLLTRLSYRIEVKDTQCGCKFVSTSWYRRNAIRFRENRFGFDLELILKAQETGCRIEEMGVRWREIEGSKVNLGSSLELGKTVLLKRIGEEEQS